MTPDSGPSSNIGLRAEKGEDVLLWISTNQGQFAFCFPPKHFGADLLFFVQSRASKRLLLVMVQCKNYSEVPLQVLIEGVRTVTPDWLWKSKNIKYKMAAESVFPQGSPSNAPDLALQTTNALRDIPTGLTVPNVQFPILRVFASWPGDSNLDRSKAKPCKKTRASPVGGEGKEKDADSHPLATLHLKNFIRMSKEMDENWFRGSNLKRSASEDLNPRKRAKQ